MPPRRRTVVHVLLADLTDAPTTPHAGAPVVVSAPLVAEADLGALVDALADLAARRYLAEQAELACPPARRAA